MVDQKYGRLTVVSESDYKDSTRRKYYNCICDCGKNKITSGSDLRRGIVKSCGCLRNVSKRNKIIGQKFGRLVVTGYAPSKVYPSGRKDSMVYCDCDCGNKNVEVASQKLRKGDTRSCGCLKRENYCNSTKYKTGYKFNKLTVIRKATDDDYNNIGHKKTNPRGYLCECECGNKTIVPVGNITYKSIKSCGCYRNEHKISTEEEIVNAIKKGAEVRDIPFNIPDDITFKMSQDNCYYCGSSPMNNSKRILYNGLDRVDSSGIYELNNVVTCCKVCNMAKHTMSKEDFLGWIEMVYNHSICSA